MDLDVAEVRRFFLEDVLPDEKPDWCPETQLHYRCQAIATVIICKTLGTDWFGEHLAPLDRPAYYFKADITDEDGYNRFMMRKMELGELLFNLRKVTAFEDRLDVIRNDQRGIEAGISELMGGRFFKCHGIMFHFLPSKGRKQEDYDIEYVRTDGRLGRCEVKSKLQGTEFSANTIKNSLKEAKKQLPRGETGIVLLRIPEVWVPWNDDGVTKLQAVIKAVEEWFAEEKTTRVSSVVVLDSRTDLFGTMMYQAWYFKEYQNPHCADKSGLPNMPTNELGHLVPFGDWVRIPDLVRQWSK
jgi:hypothetical protein